MTAPQAHVRLRGVTRVYAGKTEVHALGPIDIELAQGEFFAVVGPSGCGKSTLLDVMAGLAPPSSGEVFFESKNVKGQVPEGVGVVFQEDASFPWLTVHDNIAFGLRRAGASEAEVAAQVGYAIDFMGLKEFARAYPAQLSGGMRQRVALARALALSPEILLMDEPFAALDAITRDRMAEELLRIWDGARSVIFVTHAIAEAVLLSDRVVVMSARPGRIVADVPIALPRPRDREIRNSDAFRAYEAELRGYIEEAHA